MKMDGVAFRYDEVSSNEDGWCRISYYTTNFDQKNQSKIKVTAC
jgi:hypothetical protein